MRVLITDNALSLKRAFLDDFDKIYLLNTNLSSSSKDLLCKTVFCTDLGSIRPCYKYSNYIIMARKYNNFKKIKPILANEMGITPHIDKQEGLFVRKCEGLYLHEAEDNLGLILKSAIDNGANSALVDIDLSSLHSNCSNLTYDRGFLTNRMNTTIGKYSKYLDIEHCVKEERVAVFTVVDKNYLDKGKIALKVFKNHNPKYDYYIFSDATKTDLDSDIKSVNVDYKNRYKIGKDWPYPSQCFWIFDVPIDLLKMGYTHSVYIDADLINLRQIPDIVASVDGVAIAEKNIGGKQIDMIRNLGGYLKIAKAFKISERVLTARTNTGFLIFNNRFCEEYLAEKINKIFKRSKRINVPRKGDDSLFALYCLINNSKNIKLLKSNWNYMESTDFSNKKEEYFNNVINYHFIINKPWATSAKKFALLKWEKAKHRMKYEK